MDKLIQFCKEVGVPTIFALLMWTLVRGTLRENTKVLSEVRDVIVALKVSIDLHNQMAKPAIDKIMRRQ